MIFGLLVAVKAEISAAYMIDRHYKPEASLLVRRHQYLRVGQFLHPQVNNGLEVMLITLTHIFERLREPAFQITREVYISTRLLLYFGDSSCSSYPRIIFYNVY